MHFFISNLNSIFEITDSKIRNIKNTTMFFISLLFTININYIPLLAIEINQENIEKEKNYNVTKLNSNYLDNIPKQNYILGSGDTLRVIVSRDYPELFRIVTIDGDGTIYLPRIKRVYVKGLTVKELIILLNKRFKKYIKYPSAEIEMERYRPIRVLVNGEVANTGLKVLEGALAIKNEQVAELNNQDLFEIDTIPKYQDKSNAGLLDIYNQLNSGTKPKIGFENQKTFEDRIPKQISQNIYFPTILDVLRESGGLTEYSDLSNIEIIRKNNISEGGGKIIATINLEGILSGVEESQNIRIYDEDILNIKKLDIPNYKILTKANQLNINSRTISVIVTGKVRAPGMKIILRENTLIDAIDFAGGPEIIKGPIRYISIRNDSTVDRRKFNYSRKNKRGSYRNPFLKDGDIIVVGESGLSIANEVLSQITKPFTGLLSTYGLIKAIRD